MTTSGYMTKLERDIKKLEIRRLLTDSKSEKLLINRMIKDKEYRLNDLARKLFRDAHNGFETTACWHGELVCR